PGRGRGARGAGGRDLRLRSAGDGRGEPRGHGEVPGMGSFEIRRRIQYTLNQYTVPSTPAENPPSPLGGDQASPVRAAGQGPPPPGPIRRKGDGGPSAGVPGTVYWMAGSR